MPASSISLYQTAFRFGALSYASAMGFQILVINIVLTIVYTRILRGGSYD